MRSYLAVVAVVAAGSMATGCTGWQRKVYGAECARSGVTADSAEYESCIELARQRGMQEAQGDILAGVAIGGVAAATAEPAMAPYEPVAPAYPYSPPPPARALPVQNGPTLCPDGTYVGGRRCVLTPAGTYVGAP